MNDTSRRTFVKSLGILGLIGAGVQGYKEVKERIVYKQDEIPTKELEKQLEGKPVLMLSAKYGEELPPPTYSFNGNPYIILSNSKQYKPGTEKDVSVKIVPGPDGKLYVKENDTWRKM